jgi:hypothetical protein
MVRLVGATDCCPGYGYRHSRVRAAAGAQKAPTGSTA